MDIDVYKRQDRVRIYSVFGGIPYYNRLVDDSKSVKENIIELIASPGARLENEVSMYLNSEISKIVNVNEVFEALAKGYHKYSDILSQSHVSSGPTLVDVLDKLMKMEVVIKTSPINDKNNKRKTGYYISDNLSLFYYKYIFKYSSCLLYTSKVYKKASKKSKVKFTVKKGDKIKMIKIKPMKNVAKRPQGKYGEEKPINAYAYVKTKSGKKGWIYLSKKKSSWGRKMLFKKVPGWG